MANSIYIDVSQFSKVSEKFKSLEKEIIEKIDSVLDANAEDIATKAKQLAPVDIGGLRNSISADHSKLLEKKIAVNAFYGAYVEFGTGKYAAEYISTLPENWQSFALIFKGKGKGDYFDFLNAILDWVKRKGLSDITNSYTGKKVGGKAAKENLLVLAEAIAWAIIKNGTHPHPFLFPAYEAQRPKILEDLKKILKDI